MSNSTFLRKCTKTLLSALNFLVFSYLDFLDSVLCVIYKYLDVFFEGKVSPCYCTSKQMIRENGSNGKLEGNEEIGMSETLHGRKKTLREFVVSLHFVEKLMKRKKGIEADHCSSRNQKNGVVHGLKNRWSDCGCDSCISWMKTDDPKLHVVAKEASSQEDSKGNQKPRENVIFIHGILSSSSFWTKTLFPKLSESNKRNEYNMFAVDLLGYGKSPKPRDNLYTLNDHVEWIEKSVISEFELNSFHLVAHSMGCIIALALAAKHSKSVKSVTLVAPPYLPSIGDDFAAMNGLTPKKLWPPPAFMCSIMARYEHVGRCVCFLLCRNHRIWEKLLTGLTGLRDQEFMFFDLTKHTHHSGWHTMHNVLYGGVKQMDGNLEILMESKKKVHVVMGTKDETISPDSGNEMKKKFPDVEVENIPNACHRTVLFNRERDFAQHLFKIWENAAADPPY